MDLPTDFITTESYRPKFVWLRRRKLDGRWFFMTTVQMLHVTFIDDEPIAPWVPVTRIFYTDEELTVLTLQGKAQYFPDKFHNR